MSEKRRSYTKEYKQEVLSLLASSGKSIHALEMELGISHGVINDWKRQAEREGEQAFPGHGNRKAEEAELHQLRREVALLKQEREILKKAMIIFSRAQK
jgi:transposase